MPRKNDTQNQRIRLRTPVRPSQLSLDVRVNILADDAPSLAYLALWRRLLAPLPTSPIPAEGVAL
jgi:hypothetical protein